MTMRFTALAVVLLTSLPLPVLALKPTDEYYCCQRPDIRAGQCARFELTPERCAEIQAGFARAQREQMVLPNLLAEARRKEQEMHNAIEKNDVQGIRSLLVARKTDPPSLANLHLSPMFLIHASRFGNETIAAELIAAGVDVNGGDADKQTALMHASEKGHLVLVVRLLKAGANVNLKSMWGDTALSLARKSAHKDVVTALIDHGAK